MLTGDAVTLGTSGAAGAFATKNVGNAITVTVTGLTIGGTQASDYTLTQPTTTANISPVALTVTGITAADKIYNGNTTATLEGLTTASLAGGSAGDGLTLGTSGAAGWFATKNVGNAVTVAVTGLTVIGARPATTRSPGPAPRRTSP